MLHMTDEERALYDELLDCKDSKRYAEIKVRLKQLAEKEEAEFRKKYPTMPFFND